MLLFCEKNDKVLVIGLAKESPTLFLTHQRRVGLIIDYKKSKLASARTSVSYLDYT